METPSTTTAGDGTRESVAAPPAILTEMEASAGSKRTTLVAAILGSAVVFLDGTVVNVALPAIREDLDTGLAAQQWIVEAYLLTLGALILVGGSLGDHLGRRRIFVVGLIGFGVTSALCAIAPDRGAPDRRSRAAGHRRRAARTDAASRWSRRRSPVTSGAPRSGRGRRGPAWRS